MKKIFMIVLVILYFLTNPASRPVLADKPLNVMVSIPPQKYFVKRIAGDNANVSVMLTSGSNPETFEPKAHQMVSLARSELFFAIGVPFEKTWLERIKSINSNINIIHTDKNIKKRQMASHHHDSSDSSSSRNETIIARSSNTGFDPHIWLSPELVKIQARSIAEAFMAIDPGRSSIYQENLKLFLHDIERLDSTIKQRFNEKYNNRELLFYHPSWGYFTDTYGLTQTSVEVEGKTPKAAALARLILHCREAHIKTVFVQPQFSDKIARTLAKEIGGKTAIADPLNENWLENMYETAKQFSEALN